MNRVYHPYAAILCKEAREECAIFLSERPGREAWLC